MVKLGMKCPNNQRTGPSVTLLILRSRQPAAIEVSENSRLVTDDRCFEIVDPGQCPVELFLRDDIEVEALTG